MALLQHHQKGPLGKSVTGTNLKPRESRETKHGSYSTLMTMFSSDTTISLRSSLLSPRLVPSSNKK